MKDSLRRYVKRGDISRLLTLTPEEEAWFDAAAEGPAPAPPFAANSYYLGLAGKKPGDPIRKQCVPTSNEFRVEPYEAPDPLFEKKFSPLPGLIHRYPNRVLFLVTDKCPVYCRHCFRRYFTGGASNQGGAKAIEEAAAFVAARVEITEVLLSGGDPLMLPDKALGAVFDSFRSARKSLLLRLCTRAPVTWPSRITPELISLCRQYRPIWVSTHFNHPVELTGEASDACGLFLDAGIPVVNQTVLLKGVNDNPEVLESLFTMLASLGVKPFYLFQGDLAPGTSHFRVPLLRSFDIVEALENRLSGLSLPVFALDLPGGGGKLRLFRESIVRRENGMFYIRNRGGRIFAYPDE